MSTEPAPASPRAQDYPGAELLRTRRLRLRGLRYADIFELQRLGRDPRASQALLDAPVDNVAAACALIDNANRVYRERPGLGVWRADDEHGAFIGFFSLMAELDPDEVEIGTRLLPGAWGRGYALEAGAALCEHAFATLRLPRLIGMCDPRNRSVPPLLMRLGFAADGEAEQFGRRALRFVLRREDWRGIRHRVRGPHKPSSS
ncbi:GNAT family N-acetyltransferase [Luteimonas sp. SX5]|uniref:GNAT family N-acetyltransferase n=1 Tax=Luteimonas galliterrae TaxID=2940486 RepID=A0ABT0MPG7_9GAMM|nr:GNAT family N-acetyltransferase [Luteimonas galliterrae]MCL1636175.1 GNAT family N-acetyltransferase [Luteimonas galliterrae]